LNIKHGIPDFFKKSSNFLLASLPFAFAGASLILCIAVLFLLGHVETGLGSFLNVLIVILFISVSLSIAYYVGKGLGLIVAVLPKKIYGFLGIILILIAVPGIIKIKGYLLIMGALLGVVIYFIVNKGLKNRYTIPLSIAVLAGIVFVLFQISSPGNDDYISYKKDFYKILPIGNLKDPALIGSYKFNYITYGSGVDKQRPEFAGEALLKTASFDASTYINPTGIFKKIRKFFWGFDTSNYPLNGSVWYPEEKGTFPLILIVHGNHVMEDFSDKGYEYLGELLASRGNIVVSVDENFLNRTLVHDYGQNENIVRGILLLEHLKYWMKWNKDTNNLFYSKIDVNNIVLIGHSRGGEAVAIASEMNKLKKYHKDGNTNFDYGFNIKGIVQIAPTDFYQPTKGNPLILSDINYLLIQGGYDSDVYTPMGNRTYNRLKFSDSTNYFKSAIYSYRSNHSQFNTSWGKYDLAYPSNKLLNVKPILSAEEQLKFTKIYISAFIETITEKEPGYKRLFKDFRYALNWLPVDYYYSQYEDSQAEKIATYEEDLDITYSDKATISGKHLLKWNEEVQIMRDNWNSDFANKVVTLAWDRNDTTITKGIPEYSINWNSVTDSTIHKTVSFYLANKQDDGFNVPDFTIRLTLKNGKYVTILMSEIGAINPPLHVQLYKWSFLNEMGKVSRNYENMLQRYVIDNKLITKKTNVVNNEIIGISFIFNKAEKGEVILDNICLVQVDYDHLISN